MLPKKYKPWLIVLQVFLILGSIFLLYSKLTGEKVEVSFWSNINQLGFWQLGVIILLSAGFWFLDTSVWKLVLKPFTKISFLKALRYNIIAQSAGVLTPFLVGDYGLRSFFLRDRLETRQNTLVTLSYQLVKLGARIIVGLLALAAVSKTVEWGFLAVLLGAGLFIGGALTLKEAMKRLANTKMANRLLDGRQRLDFGALRLQVTVVPAVFLFLSFGLQTSLLAYWLDSSTPLAEILYWVLITYSLTSFLPPMSVFDPIVKSAFGTLMYTQVVQPDVLLFAFTVTWIVNRGLPAVVSGLLFRRLSGIAQATSSSTT